MKRVLPLVALLFVFMAVSASAQSTSKDFEPLFLGTWVDDGKDADMKSVEVQKGQSALVVTVTRRMIGKKVFVVTLPGYVSDFGILTALGGGIPYYFSIDKEGNLVTITSQVMKKSN